MNSLICSELSRSRKSAVLSVIFTISAAMIFILIALSFNYGNLGKLPSEAKTAFMDMANSITAPCLALISAYITSAALTDSETDVRYRMFRRSTPISPMKYSAVNAVVMGIYFVVGTALAIGLTALFCAVSGTDFTQTQLAEIFFCAELVLLFAVLTQLEQVFRHLPIDKASMIVIFTIMIPLMLFGFFVSITGMDLGITEEKFKRFLTDIFPFSPLIVAGLLGINLFFTAKAYKRREK